MDRIRLYFSDYIKWFPDKWEWKLAGNEFNEPYMRNRARKDGDKVPFFDSIEKDAGQFGLDHVEFTDIFGIRWEGTKGLHQYVGDADYERHMYYCDGDEDSVCVSDDVTADEVPDGYAVLSQNGIRTYVDMADVVDAEYKYVVENHLFKDSYVALSYKDKLPEGDIPGGTDDVVLAWDVHGVAKALKEFKPELYEKFLSKVDGHFKALRESEDEDVREFAPKGEDGRFLTAGEYFDWYFNEIGGKGDGDENRI